MSQRWSVYEIDGRGFRNYVGQVRAQTFSEAQTKAQQEYGAPIEVKQK